MDLECEDLGRFLMNKEVHLRWPIASNDRTTRLPSLLVLRIVRGTELGVIFSTYHNLLQELIFAFVDLEITRVNIYLLFCFVYTRMVGGLCSCCRL